MSHPYKNLPPNAFWAPAVARQSPFTVDGVYEKKFALAATDAIACAGSCFAQHVGRHLKAGGFAYLDAEPAPGGLPQELHSRFGYGVYSARFGNIYTARQLLQLFDRAFGTFVPVDADWTKDSRHYDAFRPAVEPDGFGERDEMRACRAGHLAAVRRMFETMDVMVFTLGLTEAWRAKADGAVYPLCPGTAAGEFSDQKYEFHNFSAAEILEDLTTLIGKVRAIKEGARFIFTVSPVSLIATASPAHVLVANTYSKSVLRGVAGEMAARFECVDYFPSYDLLASHPMRGMFYAPDMREVTTAGVEFVMKHFFSQHPIKRGTEKQPAVTTAAEELHPDDVACEEVLLQRYAPI
jgi:hypothetical protein